MRTTTFTQSISKQHTDGFDKTREELYVCDISLQVSDAACTAGLLEEVVHPVGVQLEAHNVIQPLHARYCTVNCRVINCKLNMRGGGILFWAYTAKC